MQQTLYSFTVIVSSVLLSLSACKKSKPAEDPCKSVTPVGHLTQSPANGSFEFTTSGGGRITIDDKGQVVLTWAAYPTFKIEFWGGNPTTGVLTAEHENLKGKHLKDRVGKNRTIIFPDGAKMTLFTDSAKGALKWISIYDGAECHRVNYACRSVQYSALSLATAQEWDNAEPDGETGGFEIRGNTLNFFQSYNEEKAGNKVMSYLLLGSLDTNNPTQVNDFFDDPRLAST